MLEEYIRTQAFYDELDKIAGLKKSLLNKDIAGYLSKIKPKYRQMVLDRIFKDSKGTKRQVLSRKSTIKRWAPRITSLQRKGYIREGVKLPYIKPGSKGV